MYCLPRLERKFRVRMTKIGGHTKGFITEHTVLYYRMLYISSNIRGVQLLKLSIFNRYWGR